MKEHLNYYTIKSRGFSVNNKIVYKFIGYIKQKQNIRKQAINKTKKKQNWLQFRNWLIKVYEVSDTKKTLDLRIRNKLVLKLYKQFYR